MVALSDLLKELTPEDLYEDFVEIAKALGLSTTAWQPGEPIRGFASTFSRWVSPLWNTQVLPALKALFLDYAEGDWLTLGAWVFYGVKKKAATFATGPKLTVENQAGGFWTINPGDIRFENANGKTFANIDGGTLAAWNGVDPFPTVELTFVADEAGSDSDTPPGGVPAYPSAPLQSPGEGIYLRTNTAELVGQDEETADELRQRCRDSAGPLSPAGPPDAYRFVALSTRRIPEDDPEPQRLLIGKDGDTAVNVNRALVYTQGPGVAAVRLASPSGAAAGDPVTEGSDVYLVNQAIQLLVVPVGFAADVQAADEQTATIALHLLVRRDANLTTAAAIAAAENAVLAFFRTFPIGGRKLPATSTRYIVMEEVRGIAQAAAPGIFKVTSTPSPDIAIPLTSVAVPDLTITAELVTQ